MSGLKFGVDSLLLTEEQRNRFYHGLRDDLLSDHESHEWTLIKFAGPFGQINRDASKKLFMGIQAHQEKPEFCGQYMYDLCTNS